MTRTARGGDATGSRKVEDRKFLWEGRAGGGLETGTAVRILTGGESWKWRWRFASVPERLRSRISTKDVTVTIVTAARVSEEHSADRCLARWRAWAVPARR